MNILAVGRRFGSAILSSAIIRGALTLAVFSALLAIALRPAQAQTETVLYSFMYSPDGANPYAGLLMDKLGNLYGTTIHGGAYDPGTVFKLTPAGTETVLYSFTDSNGDGRNPLAGLIMDTKGNLYGTTGYGGTSTNCASGCGTVFEVTP